MLLSFFLFVKSRVLLGLSRAEIGILGTELEARDRARKLADLMTLREAKD